MTHSPRLIFHLFTAVMLLQNTWIKSRYHDHTVRCVKLFAVYSAPAIGQSSTELPFPFCGLQTGMLWLFFKMGQDNRPLVCDLQPDFISFSHSVMFWMKTWCLIHWIIFMWMWWWITTQSFLRDWWSSCFLLCCESLSAFWKDTVSSVSFSRC